MAFADRPRLARMVEQVEQFTGLAIRPTEQIARWQTVEREFVELASDAEDLALHSLDYFEGRPSEMHHERRKRIAQRSRVALKFDPLAGAEAQLLGDFSFGKGVPKPTAREEKVQQVIDEAWTDANNEEKLTGFQAQRKLSNELMTAGELFITLYEAGGKVRVGRLDPDTVESVVPDPEDRLRPLWYMARQRRFLWDFRNDRAQIADELTQDGRPKVKYWKHWRNFDDAVAERDQGGVSELEAALFTPPAEKIAKGVVYHVAINQTGEELRGNPPWARSLRYFAAMNVLLESHVAMAQGASAFVAQRVMDGSPKQVTKAATSVLGHVSELGAGRFGGADGGLGAQGERPAMAPYGSPAPMAPGSWFNANQQGKLEALNLSSGAGQMQQTASIVRAPIAASSGFGQHYLGDASNANLATASTLELPATMRIESWQEGHAQYYRWFTDRAIEAAVKAGRLGGLDGFPDGGPISEMRLHEAEDRVAMEKRTGLDLSYEFVMPFPGRRQLPEIGAYVQAMSASMDPNGVNIALRRQLLRFAFENTGVQDVGRLVEECIPDAGIKGGIGPEGTVPGNPADPALQVGPGGASGAGGGNAGGGGAAAGPGGERPAGAKRGTTVDGKRTAASEQEWIPADVRPALDAFEGESETLFSKLVSGPAVLATLQLAAAAGTNGKG